LIFFTGFRKQPFSVGQELAFDRWEYIENGLGGQAVSDRRMLWPHFVSLKWSLLPGQGVNADKVQRIYGEGVNVAARLESLADSGGICISGIVYDQVKKKLNLEYRFLGKKRVKNIEEHVDVYQVVSGQGTQAQNVIKANVERMAFPLPEKPSIAVLPFTNMSGDPTQDYIGDGLSENIITALSAGSGMFVIARNSTFTLHSGWPHSATSFLFPAEI